MKPFEPALHLLLQLSREPLPEHEADESPELQELIETGCVKKLYACGTSGKRWMVVITPNGKAVLNDHPTATGVPGRGRDSGARVARRALRAVTVVGAHDLDAELELAGDLDQPARWRRRPSAT
jgi:hypothetical protein